MFGLVEFFGFKRVKGIKMGGMITSPEGAMRACNEIMMASYQLWPEAFVSKAAFDKKAAEKDDYVPLEKTDTGVN